MARGRLLRLGLAAALTIGGGGAAQAAEPEAKVRCKASYENAQVLKREEHLEAARAQLLICRETCPAPLVTQCAAWDAEVEALLPTVRIGLRDGAGAPVRDVRVLVDGRALASIDGPIAIDPGVHVFRFEPRIGPAVETREVVHAGEREHPVWVVLAPSPSEITTERPAPRPGQPRGTAGSRTPSWVLGGIGAATLAVAGGLAVKGHLDRSALRSDCAPDCEASDVSAIRTMWWTSAALAAVGTVAFVTAIVLWPRSSSPQTASVAAPTIGFSVGGLSARWLLP